MVPGSVGCTNCGHFKRTRRMVKSAEDALLTNRKKREEVADLNKVPDKSRINAIAKFAHRIVEDEEKWGEPKREGVIRSILAAHQTAGAKHLLNTLLIKTTNTWKGPDPKVIERRRRYLEQAAAVTCDGSCRGDRMDDNDTSSSIGEELPAVCQGCHQLIRITNTSLTALDKLLQERECGACGESLKKGEKEECGACKIFWLIRINSMETHLGTYRNQSNQNPNNMETELEAINSESEETTGRKRTHLMHGTLYTDARVECSKGPTKRARTMNPKRKVEDGPARSPKNCREVPRPQHIESNDKKFLEARRKHLVTIVRNKNESVRAKRKDTVREHPIKQQKGIDRKIGMKVQKRSITKNKSKRKSGAQNRKEKQQRKRLKKTENGM